jgi:hypothetical protein
LGHDLPSAFLPLDYLRSVLVELRMMATELIVLLLLIGFLVVLWLCAGLSFKQLGDLINAFFSTSKTLIFVEKPVS